VKDVKKLSLTIIGALALAVTATAQAHQIERFTAAATAAGI
jgi:hypothetical protein